MGRKRNESAVSNEEIISALLSSGTIAGAAAAVGIAPRTIYDRMADADFKAAYSAAKSDVLRTALLAANARLTDAIQTIADIMSNEKNNPATRLQAAQTIISTAARFTDRLRAEEAPLTSGKDTDPFADYFAQLQRAAKRDSYD